MHLNTIVSLVYFIFKDFLTEDLLPALFQEVEDEVNKKSFDEINASLELRLSDDEETEPTSNSVELNNTRAENEAKLPNFELSIPTAGPMTSSCEEEMDTSVEGEGGKKPAENVDSSEDLGLSCDEENEAIAKIAEDNELPKREQTNSSVGLTTSSFEQEQVDANVVDENDDVGKGSKHQRMASEETFQNSLLVIGTSGEHLSGIKVQQ